MNYKKCDIMEPDERQYKRLENCNTSKEVIKHLIDYELEPQIYEVNSVRRKYLELLIDKLSELKLEEGEVIAEGVVKFERFYDYDADLPIIYKDDLREYLESVILPNELIDYKKYNNKKIRIIIKEVK